MDILRPRARGGSLSLWTRTSSSREELTATLFSIADIRESVRDIREWLIEGDDGEAEEVDS